MGQSWQVINVDRREKGFADSGKLGEFFFSDLGSLYKSLHIPCLPKEVDKWLPGGTFAIQRQPIGELSTEVLDMIFEAILGTPKQASTNNFLTCMSLAIGCKRLLSVGKRHILRALISRHARAADCRIVCLGEYADKDDQAPPGMLTDAEVKELETTKMPYERRQPTDEDLAGRCLYTFASELYKEQSYAVRKQNEPVYAFMERIGLVRRQLLKAKPEDQDRDRAAALGRDLEMINTLACTGYYGPEPEYPAGPNVLCNMSKGECVREAALAKLKSQWCTVTLAHALLSRICYSPDPSMAMACSDEVEKRLAKGPWAGDRFRIVSAKDMPQLQGDREWKDVTGDVNRTLRHLWRENEGSDGEEGDGDEDGSEDSDED
ncbi:hypothetical protein GSI_03198 [Ganoderma sinense ZZ0214-1]|uniref:Uncharacterized protein n=1 Tax=Ganoderma sinense ZZ0214-1 TaxID=1077348 RepID=A0A2G8SL06_9APHY|nr:hypothetical protein GSI_03198 [Ganoderma sinense ZZ0214-1]